MVISAFFIARWLMLKNFYEIIAMYATQRRNILFIDVTSVGPASTLRHSLEFNHFERDSATSCSHKPNAHYSSVNLKVPLFGCHPHSHPHKLLKLKSRHSRLQTFFLCCSQQGSCFLNQSREQKQNKFCADIRSGASNSVWNINQCECTCSGLNDLPLNFRNQKLAVHASFMHRSIQCRPSNEIRLQASESEKNATNTPSFREDDRTRPYFTLTRSEIPLAVIISQVSGALAL